MKRPIDKIREQMPELSRRDIAALIAELQELEPYAREATAEELLLAPGHYFEERLDTRGNSSRQYLYERWYERDGGKMKHRGKMIFKGTKAEYFAAQGKED